MTLETHFETILRLDPPDTAIDVLRLAKSISSHPGIVTSLVEHVIKTDGIVSDDVKKLLRIILVENMIEMLIKDIRVPPVWCCCF
jgi:hypothetical protein